ncbi:hypothetical protein EAH86_11265 [Pedococcus bigeumensis]|uniref:Uncharacterized protein n=1 Tax=Pedococcus bigeumensis TaxID=433644 RepID=A0A502CZR0_9MICO|nr:hypothetical protein EAH86_11265 [Pedococcus bigeumensis]
MQGQRRPGQGDQQARTGRDPLLLVQTLRQREGTAQRAFGIAEPADLVEAPGPGQQLRDLVIRDLDGVP